MVRTQKIDQLRNQPIPDEQSKPPSEKTSPQSEIWQRGHEIGCQQAAQGQYIFSLPYEQLPEAQRDRALFINGYQEGLITGLEELHQSRLETLTKGHNRNQGRER